MNFNLEDDETRKVLYEAILDAMEGDVLAMQKVVKKFEGYINYYLGERVCDANGKVHYVVDAEVRERVNAKLMEAILKFKIR